ncbi:uncharacterized protein LOC144361539, partial [Saccoglossus kowalevskii]
MTSKLENLKLLDEEILNETEDDDFDKELEESDDYAIKMNEYVVKFEGFLQRMTTRSTSSRDNTSTTENGPSPDSTQQTTRKVNLPKLTLTAFSGDILTWMSFKDGFDAAVHNDSSLDDVQKFQYLRAHLCGEAARTIDGLPLTNTNYIHALDLLTKRY